MKLLGFFLLLIGEAFTQCRHIPGLAADDVAGPNRMVFSLALISVADVSLLRPAVRRFQVVFASWLCV